VSLRTAEWFDGGCEASAAVDRPVLVADFELSVLAGTVSLNPVFDLAYVDDGGDRVIPTGTTGCAAPLLRDTFGVRAGGIRAGKLAFVVPSGRGGELVYRSELDEPSGSWLIPGP
jgi:hypothetical protein